MDFWRQNAPPPACARGWTEAGWTETRCLTAVPRTAATFGREIELDDGRDDDGGYSSRILRGGGRAAAGASGWGTGASRRPYRFEIRESWGVSALALGMTRTMCLRLCFFVCVCVCVLSSVCLVCRPSDLCVCRVGTPPAR